MKNIYLKYKHLIWLAMYGILYMAWFGWLEGRHLWNFQVIHMTLDNYIPFCEYFIVPYFLWFLYVPAVLIWLAVKDKDNYYRSCIFLCTGMTVFLIISTLFPNIQHLRPHILPRDNVFSSLVAFLYRTDTPTNIWPSMHVYNSIAAHIALVHSSLGKNKGLRRASLVLCILIILATMFLKQHSVFDVLTAFLLAAIMYISVYRFDLLPMLRQVHVHVLTAIRARRIRHLK